MPEQQNVERKKELSKNRGMSKLKISEPLNRDAVDKAFRIINRHSEAISVNSSFITTEVTSYFYDKLGKNEKIIDAFLTYETFTEIDAENIINVVNNSGNKLHLDVTTLSAEDLEIFLQMLKKIKYSDRIRIKFSEKQLEDKKILIVKNRLNFINSICRCFKNNELYRLSALCKFEWTTNGSCSIDLSKTKFSYNELNSILDSIPLTVKIDAIILPSELSDRECESLMEMLNKKINPGFDSKRHDEERGRYNASKRDAGGIRSRRSM